MSRKPPVQVSQEKYLEMFEEIDLEWLILEDIAEHFNVHSITARRKLDGLVNQELLEVREGHLRSYRINRAGN